ncbi:MAG: DUF721 domain-containing protein [Bacteroidales bacterium]|nr:DUF721 domain-containing protein [Bacteroidales bacterium]
MDKYRINRKNALPLAAAIREYLHDTHLSSGLNTRRIFDAWDKASGAGPFTLKRFYRSGKLYITLNSSVVRSQLSGRKEQLLESVNDILARDECFSPEDPAVSWVQELILK